MRENDKVSTLHKGLWVTGKTAKDQASWLSYTNWSAMNRFYNHTQTHVHMHTQIYEEVINLQKKQGEVCGTIWREEAKGRT